MALFMPGRSTFIFILLNWVSFASAVTVPNDPLLNQQDYLFGERGGIRMPEAWQELGDEPLEEVVVAVLSSGVRTSHEDLKNRLWTNPDEIPGNQIDDDQNGYVDDVHGWNFFNHNGRVEDSFGMGTYAAGIIAAEHNNDRGIAGIAPNARIMSLVHIRGNEGGFAEDAGYSSTNAMIEMLQYAINEGASVILITDGMNVHSDFAILSEIIRNSPALIVMEEQGSTPEINAASFFRFYTREQDTPFRYTSPQELQRLASLKSLREIAMPMFSSLSLDHTGDDVYMEASSYSAPRTIAGALIAGVAAVLKGRYPEDDAAMLATRLIDGASTDDAWKDIVQAEGWLDALGAVTAQPTKRRQILQVDALRDFNLGEASGSVAVTSSVNLPVSIERLEGPVELGVDGQMHFTGAGEVKLRISQAGDAETESVELQEISFRINTGGFLASDPTVDQGSYEDPFGGFFTSSNAFVDGFWLRVKQDRINAVDDAFLQVNRAEELTWTTVQELPFPFLLETSADDWPVHAQIAMVAEGDWALVTISYHDPHPLLGLYVFQRTDDPNAPYVFQEKLLSHNSSIQGGRIRAATTDYMMLGVQYGNSTQETLFWRNEAGYFREVNEGSSWDYLREVVLDGNRLVASEGASDQITYYELNGLEPPVFRQVLSAPGATITLNGDWLALGLPTDSERFPQAGAVELYRFDENLGRFRSHQRVFADDARPNQRFGESHSRHPQMVFDGDWLVVGAKTYAPSTYLAQDDQQYVFRWSEAEAAWGLHARLTPRGNALENSWGDAQLVLDGSQLRLLYSDMLGSYDLDRLSAAKRALYLRPYAQNVYVDSDPLTFTPLQAEVPLSIKVLSGPGIVEDEKVLLTGETGILRLELQHPGDWTHAPSEPVIVEVQIDKYAQAIELAQAGPVKHYFDKQSLPSASSDSGLPVTWEVFEGPGEFVDGTLTAPGRYRLQVSQPGDARYAPAEPVELGLEVRPTWRRAFDAWLTEAEMPDPWEAPFLDQDGNGQLDGADYFFPGTVDYQARWQQEGSFVRLELPYRAVEGEVPLLLERWDPASGMWTVLRDVAADMDEGPIAAKALLLRPGETSLFYRLRLQEAEESE